MQKYSKNTSGFTLVELIIVITILSILATIGFTSFQGYTADARDTKRTSDLSSLIAALEAKRAGNSLSIVSFVDSTTAAHVGGTFNLAGSGMTGTGNDYNAGVMNFGLLGVAAASFQDPKGFNYSFGATRLKSGQYQFAAVIENGETPKSVVKGNYSSRKMSDISVVASARDNKVIDIQTTANYSKLIEQDFILAGTAAPCTLTAGTKVVSISSDLKSITLNQPLMTTTLCNIKLGSDETLGLIGDYSNTTLSGTTSPVTDGSTIYLAY